MTIASLVFNGCSGLTSITIPNSVKSISKSAFSDCSGLTSVTIPNSVTSIRDSAFSGCESLTSVILPNSLTTIGEGAFWDCSDLTSVKLPASVTSIGWRAFENCNRLKSITVLVSNPQKISLEYDVFYNIPTSTCTLYVPIGSKALYQTADQWKDFANIVEVGDGLKYTLNSDNASYTVSGFTDDLPAHVRIPSTCNGLPVTSIGIEAFSVCKGMTSVTIPNSVTSIGKDAFSACINLTSITIPNSVTSIGDNAFFYCTGLTSITIPNSVTSIGDYAFYKCTGLNFVNILNSVTTIGNYAFSDCSGLTSVTLPASVTSIGEGAFRYCKPLTSMTVLVEDPRDITIKSNVFAYVPISTCTLYVPSGSKALYQSADLWKDFANIVEIGGGLQFYLNSDNASYRVSGFTDELPADVCIPSTYDGLPVTEIGIEAFSNCKGLTSVSIPTSVTSIGYDAFSGCTGLTSVTIPSSVTFIGVSAFDGCSNLISVTLPNSFIEISSNAFAFTALLNDNSKYENGVLYIGKHLIIAKSSVKGDYVIKDGTLSLAAYAFSSCRSLTSVTIPTSITKISSYAFKGCSGLTSVTIPSSVTKISYGAFYQCSGLTSVTIPNSVTEIEEHAFTGTALFNDKSNWENGVLYIGKHLIKANSSELKGDYAIKDGTLTLAHSAFYQCSNLTSVSIPNSVTSISYGAFKGCSGLTSVAIPNSVTSIGYNAFFCCTGLPSVIIPESVISIDGQAFYQCVGLTSVFIPSSVTSIGECAFYNCGRLKTVTALIKDPWDVKLHWSVFHHDYTIDRTLYVPKGCKELYQTADYWKDFKNIVEIDVEPDTDSYYLSAETTDMPAGRVTMLPVTMVNEESINGFQFDVVLPQGFNLAKDENDLYYLGKSDRFIDHNVSANAIDGAVRFIAVSFNNRNFRGNDGVLCYIPVIATGNPRQTSIEIRNIKLSDSNSRQIDVAPVTATVNVLPPYTLGDANGDSEISVADVTIAISVALGNRQPNFIQNAADIDGNGQITVADVTAIINMVLNPSSASKAPARAPKLAAEAVASEESINNITIAKGRTATIEISFDSTEAYHDFQFDLTLPSGIQILTDSDDLYDIRPTARTMTHSISSSYLGDDVYRVVGASLQGATIDGGNSPIVTVEIATDAEPGTYTYSISDIEFSYVGADGSVQRSHPVGATATITVTEPEVIGSGETTGIDDIEAIQSVDDRCYDLLGRPVENPQRGFYIRGGKVIMSK